MSTGTICRGKDLLSSFPHGDVSKRRELFDVGKAEGIRGEQIFAEN